MHHTRASGGGRLKDTDKDKRHKKTRPKEFEELQYEPRSVRDLLTEMKDISELIVDLAYSALVFDSKEMADEVRDLEMKMDKLNYQIRLAAMVASRSVQDAESLTGILQIAEAAQNISDAAGDIVDLISEGMDTRPFLPFVLRDADEKFNAVRIAPDSQLVGGTVHDSNIETMTGTHIIAIKRRSGGWVFDPGPSATLRGNDIAIIRGTEDGCKRFAKAARGTSEDTLAPATGGRAA